MNEYSEYIIKMLLAMFIISLVTIILGCKTAQKKHIDTEPFEYRFQKTKEVSDTKKQKTKNVTVRFDGVPFSQAM